MTTKLHETINGPAVAVDTVVFGIDDDQLKVLLIRISGGPYDTKWALPGGLVQIGESPELAAIRVLKNKTNIRSGYLEQLYTFGNPNRDSRGQVVSVAHLLLVPDIESYKLVTSEYYAAISWHPATDLPPMAFDHEQIINFAQTRLKSKLGYSNIVHSFLPTEVTMEQLQHVYEIILGEELDPVEFTEKIQALNIVSPSDTPSLYRFKQETLNYFD